MIFTLDIYTILIVLAVLQGLVFTILFIRRAWVQERYSDYWLAALLFVFSAYLLRYVIDDINPNDNDDNILKRILPISYYVIGVVIYFYLKCQLNTLYRLSRRDLWHFLPVFVYIILFFIKTIQTYKPGSTWERPYIFQIMFVFFIVYRSVGTGIYWYLSWRLYQKYRLWLPTERSDTEGVKFKWFKNMLIVLGAMIFSGIALNLFDNFVYTTPLWIDTGQALFVAFGLYYISLVGYLQYQPQQLVYEETDDSSETQEANVPSLLISKMSNEELETWQHKILTVMQQERLYLNPELTLTDFAQRLETHSKLISAVINEAFQKNFNDFVNEYRVNIFKEKVSDPRLKHLTLLAIAFECGFNSKSTFNRAVKRITGKMPSAFLSLNFSK
jgi:AraC-like DNA-binding protein